MKINNKNFEDWSEEDIRTLLNNEDFREGQFLDYKRTFDFLEATEKLQRIKGKIEFCNDVCSFANADGGELIFGIAEKDGFASGIRPLDIKNIDKFELDLRNALLPVQPSMPNVEFRFISVEGGYVVVVHIEKGIFKPYMTVEDQSVFRFFARHGNRKDAMSYSEIRDSFLYAASLSTEIKRFRIERLTELLEDSKSMFGIIHVIPATFTNPANYIPVCDWYKEGKVYIPNQWNNYIRGKMIPNVDGVWFPSEDGYGDFQVLRLFNNGSVELKCDLYTGYKSETQLISAEFIEAIGEVISGMAEFYRQFNRHSTVYVCTTIIGCKGYRNYDEQFSFRPIISQVDRNRILCTPIEIKDILDVENVEDIIKECRKTTKYALGIR